MWHSPSDRELSNAIAAAQKDAAQANNNVAIALGRLEKHEGICAERQKNILQNISSVAASLQKLWGYLICGGIALIGGMAWLIIDMLERGHFSP